jgi:hypothetical protein
LISILVTTAACATATSDPGEREAPGESADAGGVASADAGAPPADAMPAHNDPPDAGDVEPPCTVKTINLLRNPNFDNGLGAWAQSSSGGYQLIMNQSETGITAHSGAMLGWLSGYDNALDSLSEDIDLPADATNVRIKGQRYFTTDEAGGTYDKTWVDITDAAGTTQLEQLQQWSNQDVTGAWVAFDLPLAGNYQGQTIRVRLRSDTDSSNPSWFFYDTLRFEVTSCQ